jgi:hypothetical protein
MSYGGSPVVPQQSLAELVTNPLYDSATIANAATQALFFVGANANNLALSNVPLNGQLANPKFARVGGLRLVLAQNIFTGTPSQNLVDITNILFNGFVQMVIGGLKEYITAPAFFFPAGVGVLAQSDVGAAAVGNYSACNGQPIFGSSFRLRHIISLPPMQQFGVRWAMGTGAVALTTTQRAWIVLDAELGREVL